jgi:hypothetical protein
MALWIGWAVYGAITHQGLTGWIEDLFLRAFRGSSTKLALLLAVLAGTPAFVLWGALLRRSGLISKPTTIAWLRPRRTGGLASKGTTPGRQRAGVRAQVALGLLTAALGIVVGAVFGPRTFPDPVDRSKSAPLVDLDAFTGSVPNASRVRLRGVVHGRLSVGFEEKGAGGTRTAHVFTPVTARAWTPEEPVVFVLESSAEASSLAATPTFPLDVHLRRNALPTFARSAFERAGLSVAPVSWIADSSADATGFHLTLAVSLGLFIVGLTVAVIPRARARAAAGSSDRPR